MLFTQLTKENKHFNWIYQIKLIFSVYIPIKTKKILLYNKKKKCRKYERNMLEHHIWKSIEINRRTMANEAATYYGRIPYITFVQIYGELYGQKIIKNEKGYVACESCLLCPSIGPNNTFWEACAVTTQIFGVVIEFIFPIKSCWWSEDEDLLSETLSLIDSHYSIKRYQS